jgi:ABC-2 type transport system ATP-binding protein
MIQLVQVTKQYGNKTAVRDLTLDVPAGELFAFLGPNGAGKTTTIKMMCGLLFPTSGSVRIGGHDLLRHGQQARQLISYVPDQPFLYEKLTGREFLQFIADMYGLEKVDGRRRIDEVIGLFQLSEFVDDLTEHYSHGMRQRTVFAAALLHEPKVLIVDEPTVGLDPRSVRLLKDLLRREAHRGTTVFLSSHSLDVVEELADRIAIIDRGRLVTCATLESLRIQAAIDGTLEEVFLKMTEEEKAEATPELPPSRHQADAPTRDSAPASLAIRAGDNSRTHP